MWGTSILRDSWNFKKLLKYFTYARPGSGTRNNIYFNHIYLIKTSLRKENRGQRSFKKPFECHSFNEIFYCGMNRLRNTNLGVFIKCQCPRTILRNKNMGQSLFKKHSKSENFDEIFHCGTTRLRNTILNYCGLCRYVKVIKPKVVTRQCLLRII